MFFSQIEVELLKGIHGLQHPETQLPHHLQSAIAREQGKKDLWENQNQAFDNQLFAPGCNSVTDYPKPLINQNET